MDLDVYNFLEEISILSHSVVFLNDQWKEIEENNNIGKTRDLFKKIRDTKGICKKRIPICVSE